MATQPGLKEQLFALCDEHDLNYVSISVYTLADGTRFLGAGAHGGGLVGSDKGANGSASEALSSAIAELNGKRHSVAVPELVAA